MPTSRRATLVLLCVLCSSALSADPDVFWARLRDAGRGLRTVRANCTVAEMLSLADRSSIMTGTAAWMRKPDGTVLQRWDLAATDGAGDPIRSTILVAGSEIVYLREGQVEERGSLRDPGRFHHPALGGLVFDVPGEGETGDPPFDVHAETAAPGPAKPEAKPDEGDVASPAESDGSDGDAGGNLGESLFLRPRKAPWAGLLEEAVIVLARGDRTIAHARYRDVVNNQVSVRFSGVEINPVLEEKMFKLPTAESADPVPDPEDAR